MALPEVENSLIDLAMVKGSQLKRPLFEFSGANATGSKLWQTAKAWLCLLSIADYLVKKSVGWCFVGDGWACVSRPLLKKSEGAFVFARCGCVEIVAARLRSEAVSPHLPGRAGPRLVTA